MVPKDLRVLAPATPVLMHSLRNYEYPFSRICHLPYCFSQTRSEKLWKCSVCRFRIGCWILWARYMSRNLKSENPKCDFTKMLAPLCDVKKMAKRKKTHLSVTNRKKTTYIIPKWGGAPNYFPQFYHWSQRYTYRVLQTIQMKLILLCVWATV